MNGTRVVLTSEELEGAIQLQAERIIVQGDLAKRANVSLGLQKVPLMRLMILQVRAERSALRTEQLESISILPSSKR